MALIHFNKVTKIFNGNIKAVIDVEFKIDQGEFVFLIGPSGSGKTTIIKMLIRDELPTHGRIFFKDKDITKMGRRKVYKLRRDIGVIFQDFKLIQDKTAYENVAFVMEVAGKTNKEIRETVPYLLDVVGLSHRMHFFPRQLSGGEQQRVAIARAIANNPRILVADEPTGNLDPASAWDIVQILTKINHWGTTVVMSTHGTDIVNALNKRVIQMDNGRIIRDDNRGKYEFLEDFEQQTIKNFDSARLGDIKEDLVSKSHYFEDSILNKKTITISFDNEYSSKNNQIKKRGFVVSLLDRFKKFSISKFFNRTEKYSIIDVIESMSELDVFNPKSDNQSLVRNERKLDQNETNLSDRDDDLPQPAQYKQIVTNQNDITSESNSDLLVDTVLDTKRYESKTSNRNRRVSHNRKSNRVVDSKSIERSNTKNTHRTRLPKKIKELDSVFNIKNNQNLDYDNDTSTYVTDTKIVQSIENMQNYESNTNNDLNNHVSQNSNIELFTDIKHKDKYKISILELKLKKKLITKLKKHNILTVHELVSLGVEGLKQINVFTEEDLVEIANALQKYVLGTTLYD